MREEFRISPDDIDLSHIPAATQNQRKVRRRVAKLVKTLPGDQDVMPAVLLHKPQGEEKPKLASRDAIYDLPVVLAAKSIRTTDVTFTVIAKFLMD